MRDSGEQCGVANFPPPPRSVACPSRYDSAARCYLFGGVGTDGEQAPRPGLAGRTARRSRQAFSDALRKVRSLIGSKRFVVDQSATKKSILGRLRGEFAGWDEPGE